MQPATSTALCLGVNLLGITGQQNLGMPLIGVPNATVYLGAAFGCGRQQPVPGDPAHIPL